MTTKKSMREKILSTTAKIIATEGLEAVSIRYVCEKVGVKAPTIYYYFRDKEDLIAGVVGLAYKKYTKLQLENAKEKTAYKNLCKTWDLFFEFVDAETELYHAMVIAHLSQKIPQEGVELFFVIADIFKKIEYAGGLKFDYRTAAWIFYSTAYGIALIYVSQGKKESLKTKIKQTREICLRGLLKDELF